MVAWEPVLLALTCFVYNTEMMTFSLFLEVKRHTSLNRRGRGLWFPRVDSRQTKRQKPTYREGRVVRQRPATHTHTHPRLMLHLVDLDIQLLCDFFDSLKKRGGQMSKKRIKLGCGGKSPHGETKAAINPIHGNQKNHLKKVDIAHLAGHGEAADSDTLLDGRGRGRKEALFTRPKSDTTTSWFSGGQRCSTWRRGPSANNKSEHKRKKTFKNMLLFKEKLRIKSSKVKYTFFFSIFQNITNPFSSSSIYTAVMWLMFQINMYIKIHRVGLQDTTSPKYEFY